MVTLQKYGRSYNRNVLEIAGLSTDVKPTDKLENAHVVNGSVFIEIDTGKSYIFDETNKIWNQNVSSGGGGVDGKSAYEIAVDNGFEGTEIEWLAFLKGEKGDTGADGAQGSKGDTGATGADGKSAYEVAVSNGFTGTESEWLLSLKGEPGEKGADGADGTNGIDGSNGAYLTSLVLTKTDGVITGGTVTMSDSTIFEITVTEE